MKLIDSNIIIYSASPEYSFLRELYFNENVYFSELSKLEVLGYHSLSRADEIYFMELFSFTKIISVSSEIIDTAIEIRRLYRLKTADSIIAATSLNKGLDLYSRNTKDFRKIVNLSVINPFLSK